MRMCACVVKCLSRLDLDTNPWQHVSQICAVCRINRSSPAAAFLLTLWGSMYAHVVLNMCQGDVRAVQTRGAPRDARDAGTYPRTRRTHAVAGSRPARAVPPARHREARASGASRARWCPSSDRRHASGSHKGALHHPQAAGIRMPSRDGEPAARAAAPGWRRTLLASAAVRTRARAHRRADECV